MVRDPPSIDMDENDQLTKVSQVLKSSPSDCWGRKETEIKYLKFQFLGSLCIRSDKLAIAPTTRPRSPRTIWGLQMNPEIQMVILYEC